MHVVIMKQNSRGLPAPFRCCIHPMPFILCSSSGYARAVSHLYVVRPHQLGKSQLRNARAKSLGNGLNRGREARCGDQRAFSFSFLSRVAVWWARGYRTSVERACVCASCELGRQGERRQRRAAVYFFGGEGEPCGNHLESVDDEGDGAGEGRVPGLFF
jgi:hypothetical protein